MLSRAWQQEKAAFFIFTTVSGNTSLVIASQKLNAYSPISTAPIIITVLNFLQLVHTFFGRTFMLRGKTISVMAE